jgi:hypothetical protein
MFQTPKRVGLTLPSVEQPTIFRDPPRALITRRSEKVDIADTMHRASTEDRIDENINWVPRGVDPVAGVQFSNGAGMTPNFSARVQGHAPYKVAKDGAFRPPMRRQEDDLPVSRMPRLATSLHVNQGSDDLAVRRGDAHYAVPSDSSANVLAQASGARTSFQVGPAVPGSGPSLDPAPNREDYGALPAAKAQDVVVGLRAPGTGTGTGTGTGAGLWSGGDPYAASSSLSAYAHAPRHLGGTGSQISVIDADPGGYRRPTAPARPVHMPAPGGPATSRPVLQHPGTGRETAHRQTLAGSVSVPVVGYPAARTVHPDHTNSTAPSDRFRPPPGLSVPVTGYPTRSVVPRATLPPAAARPRVQASLPASAPAHLPRAQAAATLSESTFVRPPRDRGSAPAPVPRRSAPASARVDADPGAGPKTARPAARASLQTQVQAQTGPAGLEGQGLGHVRAPVPVPVAVPLSGRGSSGVEMGTAGNVRPENRATGGDRFAPATFAGGPSPGWAEPVAGGTGRDIEPISTSVLAPRHTAGVLQWAGMSTDQREREPLQVSVRAQVQAQGQVTTPVDPEPYHSGFVREHLHAPAAPPAVALQGPSASQQGNFYPKHRTPLRANPHVSVSGGSLSRGGGGGENGMDPDGMTSKAVSADYQHSAMTVPGGSHQGAGAGAGAVYHLSSDPSAHAAPRNTPLTHMRTALQPPHPVGGSAADSAAGGTMPTRPESFGHVHAPKPDIGLRHEGWDFGARREAQKGIGMGEDRNNRGYNAARSPPSY